MNRHVRVPSTNETVQKEKELLDRAEYGENCVRNALQVNLIQGFRFFLLQEGNNKAHCPHYRIIVRFFRK